MEVSEEKKHPEGIDVASGKPERSDSPGEPRNGGQTPGAAESSQSGGRADEPENAGDARSAADAAGSEQDEPQDEVELMTRELERAKQEIEELKDHWNRERADFSNFRKRTIQERSRAQGEAVARFTRELLQVVDNLDRVLSIKSDNPEVQNFVEGVEMIRQSFVQVFQNNRIHVSNPMGEAFDPNCMEAIAREDRADLTTDTVTEVYQSGYAIEFEHGERQVLRPARVKVGVPAGRDASSESGAPSGGAETKNQDE